MSFFYLLRTKKLGTSKNIKPQKKLRTGPKSFTRSERSILIRKTFS